MKRINSIDYLRVISAIGVVAIHALTSPVTNSFHPVEYWLEEFLDIMHVCFMWSVPQFFMITGFCQALKEECSYEYCLKKAIKYIVVLFTFGLTFALIEEIYTNHIFNLETILVAIKNVISGKLWNHMWFIYSLIGIYLVLPALYTFMKDMKNAQIFVTILFIFTILIPFLNQYQKIGIDFPMGGYLFYVCFGMLVSKLEIPKKISNYALVMSFVLTILLIFYSRSHSVTYKNLIICLISIGIFTFFSQLNLKDNKIISLLAESSFAIYLLHPLFINIAIKILHIDFLSGLFPWILIKLLLLLIIVTILSLISSLIFRKIPFLKSII